MGRFAAVLFAGLTMTSCGGTDPVVPLDTGFAKIWNGVPTLACTGAGTTVYPASTLEITVSGNSLTTRLSCVVGNGTSVTATGSGSTAIWTGSFSCPSDVQASCPSGWVFTHTSRTYTLNANGTLTVSGAGTLVGCGITTDCTTSFPGT
jgi:hypothetical protein